MCSLILRSLECGWTVSFPDSRNLSTYCVPATAPGAGDTRWSTNQSPDLGAHHFPSHSGSFCMAITSFRCLVIHSTNMDGAPPMCPTRENKEKQRPGLLMRSLKFSIICGLFLSLASPCSHVHSVNVLSVTRGGGEIQILIFPKFTSLGGLGSIMIFKASMHSFISLFINMLSPE